MKKQQTLDLPQVELSACENVFYNEVIKYILDRDYDDIERDIFGFSAMECLPVNPETQAAFPQGNPFLRKAKQIGVMFKGYKGIYSL